VPKLLANTRDHTETDLLEQNIERRASVMLVAGGYGFSEYLASAELYSPAADVWVATGNMENARESHTATLLPDGRGLVGGGVGVSELSSSELYVHAAGEWTATGSVATERVRHTATLLPNGQVLVAGGFQSRNSVAKAELYDPATARWTATDRLFDGRW